MNVNDSLETPSIESDREVTRKVVEVLQKAKDDMSSALCDSFNTPAAMAIISELVTTYNSADKAMMEYQTVSEIAKWVTLMVNVFGLNGSATPDDTSIGWSGIDIPKVAKPYIKSLSQLRDYSRRKARSANGLEAQDIQELPDSKLDVPNHHEPDSGPYEKVLQDFRSQIIALEGSSALSNKVLELCDRVRDVDLWDIGIYLEDRDGNQPALIRPVTKELRASRLEREVRKIQKQKAKERGEEEIAARVDKGRQSHLNMFQTAEYSSWDDEGLPIKDKAGNDIAKNKAKKLKKEWDKQKERHETWVKANVG